MTIKEKLETIKGKKIAIWCEEEWMAIKLYESLCEKQYCCWFGDDFCVDLEEEDCLTHCYLEWYEENDFEVIKFNDFINEPNKTNITQQDIAEILNDKYGKDNWVIR